MSTFFDELPALDGVAGNLYQRLQHVIRNAIESGSLAVNEPIPAERTLAERLSVSRVTVRKALDGLVAEGFLVRRQGAGTYVAGRVEKSFSKLSSFSEDMAGRGLTARSTWLRREAGTATPEESMSLGLGPGAAVYRFHRIRYADDLPMALEYSTLAGFALASVEQVETSLYAALSANGLRPVRALQRLRAVALTGEQAAHLGCEIGDPALWIERRSFAADGRIVEITRSYYHGGTYDFVAELSSMSAPASSNGT